MKTSEKIIKRLYEMGAIKSPNAIAISYRGSRNGSWNWAVSCGISDIGSTCSMKECLSWKRWIYCGELHEIFEYHEGQNIFFGDIVEKEN